MILSTGVVAMADETKDPSEVKVGVITDVGGVKRRLLQPVCMGRSAESSGRAGNHYKLPGVQHRFRLHPEPGDLHRRRV